MFYKKLLPNIKILSALLFLISACSDSGTGPNPNKSVRDYTWTSDTLAYPGTIQTLMSSIWAASPTDIYAVGHCSDNNGHIWHYDGTSWRTMNIFRDIARSAINIYDVSGTSQYDVWVVGSRDVRNPNSPPTYIDGSFIIQYNGFNWIEHQVNTYSKIYSVYANTPNDVWAGGEAGIVYHFDGSAWTNDTIVPPFEGSYFKLNNITVFNNKPYAIGNTQDLTKYQDVFYFFSTQSNNWVLLDSMRIDAYNTNYKWGVGRLYPSPWGKLYSSGWGIFEYNNSNWDKIIPFFDIYNPIRWMRGTNENNIILVGDFGKAYHWNGSDLYKISVLEDEDILYTAVWSNEKEAFIIGYTTTDFPEKTVVWHGK